MDFLEDYHMSHTITSFGAIPLRHVHYNSVCVCKECGRVGQYQPLVGRKYQNYCPFCEVCWIVTRIYKEVTNDTKADIR